MMTRDNSFRAEGAQPPRFMARSLTSWSLNFDIFAISNRAMMRGPGRPKKYITDADRVEAVKEQKTEWYSRCVISSSLHCAICLLYGQETLRRSFAVVATVERRRKLRSSKNLWVLSI